MPSEKLRLEMDEQVSTSQQLLEMRSEKIAALQAELRRLREGQDLDGDGLFSYANERECRASQVSLAPVPPD